MKNYLLTLCAENVLAIENQNYKWPTQIPALCIAMMLAASGHLQAGTMSSSIVLDLSASGPSFFESLSGDTELAEHALVASAGAVTSGGAYASDGDLGIVVTAWSSGRGGLFDPYAIGHGKVNWFDRVSLTGIGDLLETPRALQFEFDVSGTIRVFSTGTSAQVQSFASATAIVAGNGIFDQFYGFVRGVEDQGLNLFPPFTVTIPLISMSAEFYYGLDVRAETKGGSAVADFYNTMKMNSITFPDGTTPESHGFELAFASGIQSPNLQTAAVPEPASLITVLMGAFTLTANCFRHRRRSSLRSI